MAVSKLVLIGSGVGVSVATAGGVAFYLTSGETIVNYISKLESSKNKKFIALISDAQSALKSKYSSSNAKKPAKEGKNVENIVEWCKESENIKFSSESDPNYPLINTWCFVNINSLSQEAKSKNKTYISDKARDNEEWKKAWEAYNSGKGTGNLQITESTMTSASSKDKGGPALHDWCKVQDEKKMYEENSEETYKRYEKWCFKDK